MEFKIELYPVRSNDAEPLRELTISKEGGSLWVNGVEYDFNPLNDGDALPAKAITGSVFVNEVSRVGNTIHVILKFPFGEFAGESVHFPKPIDCKIDGNVNLPNSGFRQGVIK